MDRDREFAIGALGLASSGITTPDPEHLVLRLPLKEGAIVRVDCACGIMVDLNEVQMRKLGAEIPVEQCAGMYLAAKGCPFCSDTYVLQEPVLLPIP